MFRKLSTAALSGSFWGTSCHKDQCRSLAHRRLRCEPLEDRRLLSVFNLPDAEYATVAAAVASATYGDTINLPADTAVWNSHLSITKGITIQGAGESSTIIISNYAPGNTSPYTATNYLIDFTPDATSLANDTPFQISGITFDLDGKCGGIMLKNTTTSPYTITTHNHIDHCTIQNATGGAAVGITVQGPLYGTIDHNTFANNSKTGLIYGLNLTSWNNPGTPYAYGTAENVIFENNAITFTTNVPPVSIGQGAKACLRNNTFTYNGIADIYGWFSIEGNMTSLHAAMGAEIYGNTLISVNNKNIRIFSHKGGKALIYNNDVITTGTVSAIATEEYTDPTTNNPQPEHVSDSYYWNNTKNGTTLVTPTITTYSGVYALQWDVDCWKQVASFNGTTGVGVGTLANRPATCTTGVGYFATDEGEHGTLFKATATNTWTAYYEPYDANPFPDDWIIAASAEYADVAAAVASATYGDTVYVPAGEATWASALVITKGITLRGASAGQTVITAGHDINNSNALSPSHYVIAYVPDAASIANDTPFRVTDFTLDMDNRCAGILIKHTTSLTPITQIQIDHCEILNCHAAQYSPRVIYAHGTIYGFIDHNTFNNNSTILISGLGQSSWDTYAPYVFGSPNNIFIEYNTFTVPNTQCLVDLQNGQGYVFRYNTANFTGTSSVWPMVTIHGNQGSGLYAGMGAEVYGNTLNAPNNTGNPICMIMQRGGRMMVFDNTVNTPTTNVFTLVYDEFADSLNPTINQPQHPTDSYYWNNKRNGTTRFNAVIHDNWPTSVTENVDFWNQQTTFNGTVGMGVGLLANRPATCTVGVGYFATDVGPLGTFYKATAANTWTKYYEPYNEETPMFLSSNLFYNNSSFDGQSAAANVWDDAAIALDKTPLLPGQTASIDNYTSYSRGINGLMMNFANLPGTVTAADFTFKVGNSNTPETWAPAPVPTSITQRKVNGMDRVTVIWPDGAIAKQWLQVTVKATSNTGLKEDVVFYFGNAIGEVGNSTADAVVNASDESGIRANLASLTQAVITNHYDINRDGLVNATDQALVRANLASLNALRLITVPGAVKSSAISSALQEASLSDSAIDEATLSALAASAVQKTAATAVRQSTATEAALQTLDWNRLAAALSIAGNPLSGQGTSGFSFLNQSEED